MSKKSTKENESPHKINQEIFQPPIKKNGTSDSRKKVLSNQGTMSTSHGKTTAVIMVTQCHLKPESGEKISIFPTEKTVVLPHKNINPRSKNKK